MSIPKKVQRIAQETAIFSHKIKGTITGRALPLKPHPSKEMPRSSVGRNALGRFFLSPSLWIVLLAAMLPLNEVQASGASISVPRYDYTSSSQGRVTINWSCSAQRCALQQYKNGYWTNIESVTRSSGSKSVTVPVGSHRFTILPCTDGYRAYCAPNQDAEKTVTVRRIPSASPEPSAPGEPTGTYTVSWDPTPYTSVYRLEERLNGGRWKQVQKSSKRSKQFPAYTKSVGTYEYRVRSCRYNKCATAGPVKPVSVAIPESAPTLTVQSTSGTGTFNASWTKVPKATTYRLARKIESDTWRLVHMSSSRSKSFSGLSDNRYQYRAYACNGFGCGPHSSVKVTHVARKPTITEVNIPSSLTDGDIAVSWESDDSVDIDKYQVSYSSEPGKWSSFDDFTKNQKSDTYNLGEGTYRFKVRALNIVEGFIRPSNWVESGDVTVSRPTEVPSITLGSKSNDGDYTVGWDPTSNTKTYEIQEAVGQDPAEWSSLDQVSFSSEADSPYRYQVSSSSDTYSNPDNRYWYRVRACNDMGCGNYSQAKRVDVARPPVLQSQLDVPDLPTDGNFLIGWDQASGNVTAYDLRKRLAGSRRWQTIEDSGDPDEVSHSVSGLSAGSWELKYQACNLVYTNLSCSGWSSTKTVVAEKPQVAPTLEGEGTSNGDDYSLSWKEVDNANEYHLYRSDDGGSNWDFIQKGEGTSKTENFSSSGVYHYKVAACNSIDCGPESGVKAVKAAIPPSAPESIRLSENDGIINTGEFTVRWDQSTGRVSEYRLQQRREGQSWGDLKYKGTNLAADVAPDDVGRYEYRVRACNIVSGLSNCSSWETLPQVISVIARPEPPINLAAEPTESGGVQLSWENPGANPDNIDFHVRYNLNNSGNWISLYDGSGLMAELENVDSAVYRFEIRSCLRGGDYPENGICSKYKHLPEQVGKPVGTLTLDGVSQSDDGSATISWEGEQSGKHYKLQRTHSTSGKTYTVEARSKDFGALENGVHTLKVRACNKFGCGTWSESKTLTVAKTPGAPSFRNTPGLSDGNLLLKWNNGHSEFTKHELDYRKGPGSWTQVTINTPNQSQFTLSSGNYKFRIRACLTVEEYESCSGYAETEVQVALPKTAPSEISLPPLDTDGKYNLSWEAVENASRYEVQQSVGDGSWAQIANRKCGELAPSECTQLELSEKTENIYGYRIKACNRIGCSAASLKREVQVIIRPEVPASLSGEADLQTGKTRLSWPQVTEPVSYFELDARVEGSRWQEDERITSDSNSTVWSTAVPAPGDYRYRVRACRQVNGHTVCSSGWRPSAVVTYSSAEQAPALSAPFHSESGEFQVDWSSVLEASHYELVENAVALPPSEDTDIEFSGSSAKAGGFYTYSVRACNVFGCSGSSNTRTVVVDSGADDGDDSGDGSDSGGASGSTGGDGSSDGTDTGAEIRESGNLEGPPDLPSSGNPVGATQGQFKVNESGAANYQVPLSLPKGTADVTPELSFNYSSQGGTGLLGHGWSIGGLSSIQRCRQTKNQDGVARPITWTRDDRLCLDGQRLIQTASGAYDSDGMTYKTEIDSYVEVVSKGGGMNSSSGYFEVVAKDGSTRVYGDGHGSRVNTASGTLSWAKSHFKDSVGNYITYHYMGGSDTGQRISSIEYAYASVGSVSNSNASVDFEYEDSVSSSAAPVSYVAGHKFSQTKRLKSVKISNTTNGETGQYRRYKLAYQSDDKVTTDRVSRLESITECVNTVCLEPTVLDWAELGTAEIKSLEDPAFPDPPSSTEEQQVFADNAGSGINRPHGTHVLSYKHIDVNGDGLLDLIWYEYSESSWDQQTLRYAVMKPDGEGYENRVALDTKFFDLENSQTKFEIHPLDYNGDGRTDVITRTKDGGSYAKWKLYISTPKSDGSGWKLEEDQHYLPFNQKRVRFGDVDGDGLADAFYVEDGALHVHYLQAYGADAGSKKYYRYNNSAVSYEVTGLPDIEQEGDFGEPYWEVDQISDISGDFTGNGAVDFVLRINEMQIGKVNSHMVEPAPYLAGSRRFVFSREEGELKLLSEIPIDRRIAHAVDINGDGLTDLIYKNAPHWKFVLNRGNGWDDPVPIDDVPASADEARVHVADINRDGYQDVVWATDSEGLQVRYWYGSRFSDVGHRFSNHTWRADGDPDDYQFMVADLDGDGWQDYLWFDREHSVWAPYYSSYQGDLPPNVLTGIQDGLGQTVAINYELLTDTKRYARTKVGDSTSRELDEVCFNHVQALEETCHTPVEHSLDTEEFYTQMNEPFSAVPEGNDVMSDSGSPVMELYTPMAVVTDVIRSSPSGNESDAEAKVSYYYDQLRFQAGGRGSLGFRRLVSVDHQSKTVTETTYRQDWPFIGSPLKTVTRLLSDGSDGSESPVLSEAVNRWKLRTETGGDGQTRYVQTYIKETEERRYGLSDNGESQGQLIQEIKTETEQDQYGNNTLSRVINEPNGNTHTKRTVSAYNGAGGGAKMGRLSRTEVTTEPFEGPVETRVAEFTYYPSGPTEGMLHTEVLQPGSLKALTKTHHYDDYGNQKQITYKGADGVTREGDLSTYEDGRYLKSVVNALGHTTRNVETRNTFGQPTEIEDIHQAVTTVKYDDLGREYQRSDASGAWTWKGRAYCGGGVGCPSTAVYRAEERVAGGGKTYTYYDVLRRPVREAKLAFKTGWTVQDTEYDERGLTRRVSTPFSLTSPDGSNAEAAGWIETEYDALGRPEEVTQPDGTVGQTMDYDGLTTSTTNALGHTKTETKNLLGELAQVTDNDNGTVSYRYNAQGELLETTTESNQGQSVKVRICYDELGHKKAMHDPDKGGFLGGSAAPCDTIDPTDPPEGWWGYKHNSLGELVEQVDPKGQTRILSYDALGRKETRTDYRAEAISANVESHTRWYYDSYASDSIDPGERGNLVQVVQSFGNISEGCDSGNYCQTYAYDSLGRLNGTFTFHPDNEETGYQADTGYMTGVDYDAIGRTYVKEDAMMGLVNPRSGIHYRYNDRGYRTKTIDLASGDVLHRVVARDAWGNITEEERGNGYTTRYEYDPYFGRLKNQEATAAGTGLFAIQNTDYKWDDVGNLKWRHNQSALADQSGTKNLKESFCYDGLNRLIKSHTGTLFGSCNLAAEDQDVEYDGLGNITRKHDVGDYSYGSNAGPHAVTEAGGVTYQYDDNGNQTSGDGRTLRYTSFDKPYEITKGDHTSRFEHGPERSRFRRTDEYTKSGVAITKTTTYLGNVERIESSNSNTITWRRTVAGAVYITETDKSYQTQGSVDKSYIYKDHLGSTDVITGKTGTIKQSMSFDAWGQRRDSNSWDPISDAAKRAFNTELTNDGFTGHEQLDEVGLIHMNGRVYDPKLARFLQADPFIQAPSNTQSYNRYSYLWNNPLNATDPSGYFLKSLWNEIRPFVGAIVAVGLCAWNACVGAWDAIAWGIQAGGISGAIGAAANGGNVLEGAAIGAFTALGYGVGGWLGGGVASGIVAESQGGEFLPSFAAAGFGSLLGGQEGPWGFVMAAVGGGVASEITGGKFKNGAATAAFTWALSAGLSKDEVVTNGRGSGSHEDLPKVKPDFYDDNGNPLSVHDSLEGALQAGEDASRAAQQASGQDHEYGVLTITGHVTDEGVQTYYNSAVGTSYDSHAIRWSVVGLRDNLVAINHSHPNNKGFSQGDRDAYRGLRKSGFSNFKGVYMFDDKGNHWYGPRRKTWGIFGTRTHSCGGADATSWSCPSF